MTEKDFGCISKGLNKYIDGVMLKTILGSVLTIILMIVLCVSILSDNAINSLENFLFYFIPVLLIFFICGVVCILNIRDIIQGRKIVSNKSYTIDDGKTNAYKLFMESSRSEVEYVVSVEGKEGYFSILNDLTSDDYKNFEERFVDKDCKIIELNKFAKFVYFQENANC